MSQGIQTFAACLRPLRARRRHSVEGRFTNISVSGNRFHCASPSRKKTRRHLEVICGTNGYKWMEHVDGTLERGFAQQVCSGMQSYCTCPNAFIYGSYAAFLEIPLFRSLGFFWRQSSLQPLAIGFQRRLFRVFSSLFCNALRCFAPLCMCHYTAAWHSTIIGT